MNISRTIVENLGMVECMRVSSAYRGPGDTNYEFTLGEKLLLISWEGRRAVVLDSGKLIHVEPSEELDEVGCYIVPNRSLVAPTLLALKFTGYTEKFKDLDELKNF